MKPLLEVRGADLGHGGKAVLSDVELTLDAGELCLLFGPSGGGKTTLLRAAVGLLEPLAGRIELRTDRRAWVPQHDRLDDLHPVSVFELVSAGAARELRGLRRVGTEITARVEAALQRLGLEGFEHRPFATLSGGQRQRALVARALLARAELIVMDEPTSALDADSAALVREAVAAELQRGAAVLYTTHEPELFAEIAGPRVEVADGRATPITSP